MSQATTFSAIRSAIVAVGFVGLVAAGFAARGNDPSSALSAADDYGTRHAAAAPADADAPGELTHGKLVLAPQLGLADDFATRQVAQAAALGLADDFGTRNVPAAAEPVQLDAADDYGTRHQAAPEALGPNDDYGTRNAQ